MKLFASLLTILNMLLLIAASTVAAPLEKNESAMDALRLFRMGNINEYEKCIRRVPPPFHC
jgi:hypothetical protein